MLGIYLNDHLAGATAGTELARRVAGSAQDREDHAALRGFAAEVAQDRVALLNIMAMLGIPVRTYKVYAGWIGEKAGRLEVQRPPLHQFAAQSPGRAGNAAARRGGQGRGLAHAAGPRGDRPAASTPRPG